ncbi:MAG TPA: CPBP family intramembrane glutamic endopeptidase, partial [Planctomycetota bacterium]|nr:CPBP family intramembrane glutamic endopeptidase [Planctomycetota bacterium]
MDRGDASRASTAVAAMTTRSLVAWWLVGSLGVAGVLYVLGLRPTATSAENVLRWTAIFYAPPALWLAAKLRRRGIRLAEFVGSMSEKPAWLAWTGIVIGAGALTTGFGLLLLFPLAWIAPRTVESALGGEGLAPGASVAALRAATLACDVLVAPVVEELVFRGFLLRRWSEKWGIGRAVVATSIVFGAVHIELVGHAFSGFVFAALFVR